MVPIKTEQTLKDLDDILTEFDCERDTTLTLQFYDYLQEYPMDEHDTWEDIRGEVVAMYDAFLAGVKSQKQSQNSKLQTRLDSFKGQHLSDTMTVSEIMAMLEQLKDPES